MSGTFSRRLVLKGTIITFTLLQFATNSGAASLDYLAPTPMIDSEHPAIAALAARLAPSDLPETEKANRIFHFVRDDIKFGFGPRFYEHKASEVAEMQLGYCNTKGTLIVALMRAAGIPARQAFVDIDAKILDGIVDPGTPFVDHSFVEIQLNKNWIATDAYIVDRPLFNAAQKRLKNEGKTLGFGTHRLGTINFSATRNSFSQFVADQAPQIALRHYGVHADVMAFYEATPEASNRLRFITRLGFPVFALAANRNAENLRVS